MAFILGRVHYDRVTTINQNRIVSSCLGFVCERFRDSKRSYSLTRYITSYNLKINVFIVFNYKVFL